MPALLRTRVSRLLLAALAAGSLWIAFDSLGGWSHGRREVDERESAGRPGLPAFTAEEEQFAADLWAVHNEVKLAAIRTTFAGIHFASGGSDAARLVSEIEPAIGVLERAAAAVEALVPPAGLAPLHARYRRAVGLYREAAVGILEAAPAGDLARLLEAQRLSFEASEETLRIGDRLWPAEYKPH